MPFRRIEKKEHEIKIAISDFHNLIIIAATLTGGCLIGSLTFCGKQVLTGEISILCSSIAVWLVVPFLLARRCRNVITAILSSSGCLLIMLVSYWFFESTFTDVRTYIDVYNLVWIACGIVGGSLWGAISYPYPTKNLLIQSLQKTILSAAFIAETFALMNMTQISTKALWILIASVILVGVERKNLFTIVPYISLAINCAIGLLGFNFVLNHLFQIFYSLFNTI